MAIEYELKLNAEPQALISVEKDLGGSWRQIEMRTTYYDTPERTLSARKWTLRRRLENGLSVCTLKTPADLGRQEFEVNCDTIEMGIEELCKLGAPQELVLLTAGGVEPVCGAAFTRLAQKVELEDCTVEVALDQGELFGGEKIQPLCELEVELKEGEASAARNFALILATKYRLLPENKSKFKRALALTR